MTIRTRLRSLAPMASFLLVALIVGGMLLPQAARADDSARRIIGGFLGVGGYFLTADSGKRAIGDVKFASDTALFVRPKHLGAFLLTGGVEIFDASDHFFPFTGGNDYNLTGLAFRVTTHRVLGRIRPVLTAGIFAGTLRSERLGFDRTQFTPSVSIGAEWPFARYFTLVANYRISQRINGYDNDGFGLMLRVFN